MGWRKWLWLGGVLVGTGCGSWTLRHGTSASSPQADAANAPYVWQKEGTFPAPAAVEPAPAGASLEAEASQEDSLATRAAMPYVQGDEGFSVESLPAVEASPPLQLPAAREATEVAGFRVQVFATRSREAAERLKEELQNALSLPSHLDFEDPYFKVRVGDCRSEVECRLLQEQLRSAGYATAFVVPARITAP